MLRRRRTPLAKPSTTTTKTQSKSPRMRGTTLILILMVVTVAAGGLTIASVYINGSSTKTGSLVGVVVAYGPSAPASYNVTLVAKNGVGNMTLTPFNGSADLITDHDYAVSDVLISPYNITMVVGGQNVSLGWITTSTIWSALNDSYGQPSMVSGTTEWNDLNSSYVAASGPASPANQTIGRFSSSVFGVPTSYHFFIGLTIPHQPPYNIPFAVRAPLGPSTTRQDEERLAGGAR